MDHIRIEPSQLDDKKYFSTGSMHMCKMGAAWPVNDVYLSVDKSTSRISKSADPQTICVLLLLIAIVVTGKVNVVIKSSNSCVLKSYFLISLSSFAA